MGHRGIDRLCKFRKQPWVAETSPLGPKRVGHRRKGDWHKGRKIDYPCFIQIWKDKMVWTHTDEWGRKGRRASGEIVWRVRLHAPLSRFHFIIERHWIVSKASPWPNLGADGNSACYGAEQVRCRKPSWNPAQWSRERQPSKNRKSNRPVSICKLKVNWVEFIGRGECKFQESSRGTSWRGTSFYNADGAPEKKMTRWQVSKN